MVVPLYSVAIPGLAVSSRVALTDCKQVLSSNYDTYGDAGQIISSMHQSDADSQQVIAAAHQVDCDVLQIVFAVQQWNADALQVISAHHETDFDTAQIISFAYQNECDLEQVISAVFSVSTDMLLRIMYSSIQIVRGLCHLISEEEILDSEVIDFILKAQGRIDARLRLLYQIPLRGPVPEIINSIATDMAASFVLDKRYSDRRPDQTSLADVYMRRAEKDLDRVISEDLLDGLPGIIKLQPPTPSARPAIATTTRNKSQIEEVLSKW